MAYSVSHPAYFHNVHNLLLRYLNHHLDGGLKLFTHKGRRSQLRGRRSGAHPEPGGLPILRPGPVRPRPSRPENKRSTRPGLTLDTAVLRGSALHAGLGRPRAELPHSSLPRCPRRRHPSFPSPRGPRPGRERATPSSRQRRGPQATGRAEGLQSRAACAGALAAHRVPARVKAST